MKYGYYIMLGWGAMMLVSCNGYLDVKPKDRYLQTTVYADAATTELIRKGIYTLLASDALYGGTLTMGAVDIMGQYYFYNQEHALKGFAQYDYTDPTVQATFSQTWKHAYNTLLNINSFIEGVKNEQSVISEGIRQQYLGEAYGLRAYLHFDLLRLFGPVYSENPNGVAIPYVVAPTAQVPPMLSAKEVGLRVMADLDSADMCLSAAREMGMQQAYDAPARLSVVATWALRARAALYLGDREQAVLFAQKALDGGVVGDDIFALHVAEMSQQYDRYFSPEQLPSFLLSPMVDVLITAYGANTLDSRYQSNWVYFPQQGERIAGFVKYSPPASTVPMLRTSELYYILAECTTDERLAESYLSRVGEKYNEQALPGNSVDDKLPTAYRREFWGEGQLFYFYKRRFQKVLPSATSIGATVGLDADDYQVPVPTEELIYR